MYEGNTLRFLIRILIVADWFGFAVVTYIYIGAGVCVVSFLEMLRNGTSWGIFSSKILFIQNRIWIALAQNLFFH